eukprot:Sspe_Gene.119099::Locus_114129_Transcript_1_1_Confidence_1.000_Length_1284::g.119099::m.119099/K07335/bmpA, bmpB, tmpC; basic membrane protein A and related proteins
MHRVGVVLVAAVLLPTAESTYNVIFLCQTCDASNRDGWGDYYKIIWRAVQNSVAAVGGTAKVVESRIGELSIEENLQIARSALPGVNHVVAVHETTELVHILAPEYPDVKWSIPGAFYLVEMPNLQGIAVREDQLGFLAGMLAGGHTKTGRVAVLAGPQFPILQRFRNGFNMGVRRVCEACEVDGFYCQRFDNITEGIELGRLLVSRGADVLFGAAGLTGSSAIFDVAGPTYVIGVDTDEWYTTFARDNGTKGQHLLGSAVARVDMGVRYSIEEGIRNEFKGGWKLLDITVDGVAITDCHVACPSIEMKTRLAMDLGEKELREGVVTTNVDVSSGAVSLPLNGSMYFSLRDHFGDGAPLRKSPWMAKVATRLYVLGENFDEAWWYNLRTYAVDHLTVLGSRPSDREGAAGA